MDSDRFSYYTVYTVCFWKQESRVLLVRGSDSLPVFLLKTGKSDDKINYKHNT